ncbi:hypothetical protein CC79DRAFT_1363949 [Sarocladium strictum]
MPNSDDYAESSPSQPPLTLTGKLFKRDVHNALEGMEFVGDFATFDQYQSQRIRSIKVKDVGDVSLPLKETQARQMIEKARLAPFGKGTETIVDTSVRNTWELNPDQFELGSEFSSILDLVRAKVRVDLGIRTNIRAELYKMLIYEKGALFKPHKDTEKTPGMFGTLGVEKTYDTSSARNTFAAWYGDVTHEVLPVESGYRWVLTYNLAIDSVPELPSASLQANHSNIKRIEDLLQSWLTTPPATRVPTHFYAALEHKYTEANISLRNLKQSDLLRAQALMKLSWTLPIKVLLAVVEKQVTHAVEEEFDGRSYGHEYSECGSEDPDMDSDPNDRITDGTLGEEMSRSSSLKRMVDMDGNMVLQNVDFNEKNFLNRDCFDPENPDDEEESGFTGNEGAWTTLHYNVAALLVVPIDTFHDFLYKTNRSKVTCDLIHYWAKECAKSDSDSDAHKALAKCWESEANSTTEESTNPAFPTCVQNSLAAALKHRDFGLLEAVASAHKGRLRTDCLVWLRRYVEEQYLDGAQDLDFFVKMQEGLSKAILAYPSVRDMILGVLAFSNSSSQCTSSLNQAIQTWKSSVTRQFGSQWPRLTLEPNSADTILLIIGTLDDPVEWVEQDLLPCVKAHVDLVSFWHNLLEALSQKATDHSGPCDTYRQLYRAIVRPFLEHWDIYAMFEVEGGVVASGMTPKDLISFITTVLRMAEDGDGTKEVLWEDILESCLCDVNQIVQSWVPFISSLTRALPKTDAVLTDPRYCNFHDHVLRQYLNEYVRDKPDQTKNYAREPVNCACIDCKVLNKFLVDSQQKAQAFAAAEKRRRHMQMELTSARVDCECFVVRQGSPHSLNVIKKFSKLEMDMKVWNNRRHAAEKVIAQLKPFKAVLGPVIEMAEGLLHLLCNSTLSERPDAGNAARMNTAKRARGGAGSGEASKRQRQEGPVMIDLTGE